MTDPMTRPGDVREVAARGDLLRIAARIVRLEGGCEKGHRAGQWHIHEEPFHAIGRSLAADVRLLDAARAAHSPDQPVVGEELAEARATIEAMSGDAADLIDLMDEAAAMRTVLHHLLDDNRGRIHDSGCGICDAGRALLTADHELPSFAATTPEDQS